MIAEICFTTDWLDKKRKELKGVDPSLLERALHAFALLGHLAESDLKFVFKGGTSLLLHVPKIRRLSIDIDILCSAPAAELDRILKEVAKVGPFTDYEEHNRGARGLPERRHFKFFYKPLVAGNPDPYVLLDVVEEPEAPHEVVTKPITPQILEIGREILVTVPTIESLLADKLTAFAPHTVGVPVTRTDGKAVETMQIMKQLFDVGELFSLARDLEEVRTVYTRVFELENSYRDGQFSKIDALRDTLDMSLRFCLSGYKGALKHADVTLLEEGRRKLEGHLVDHRFDQQAAKIAAAKAGLLARLILTEAKPELLFESQAVPAPEKIRPLEITGGMHHLNRLKAINPEAFWYWYQASGL
ncbi:MAG: hypothetical protein A2X83_05215 [Desulfuromonadales bacterium GWD2_54_10]|nr:MAG: hypothetical protein A2X83_05215 [Desulfuromonadales bacterium GWD2_54_10]